MYEAVIPDEFKKSRCLHTTELPISGLILPNGWCVIAQVNRGVISYWNSGFFAYEFLQSATDIQEVFSLVAYYHGLRDCKELFEFRSPPRSGMNYSVGISMDELLELVKNAFIV